tara:strand:+ start:174 stop:596 length:423 start_codon:yes stop_codon:yes gene_type:complete
MNEATKDLTKVVNAFTVFKFIKLMVSPFEKTDAYKYGIIDKNGKFLKSSEELTSSKEKKSVDIFHRLIFNLKKMIKKIPDPQLQAQMKTLPSAMFLIKEEAEKIGADGDVVLSEIKRFLITKNIDIDSIDIDNSFTELEK